MQMTAQPFIFQPFSAGPRICLGQQFGYNSITMTLVKLCQSYERIDLARDVQTVYLAVPRVILCWNGGMWVRFIEANVDA
jgi:cytochrome P450